MAGNSFGTLFRLTTFGESHGPAIGGVLEGCPSGLNIDPHLVQIALDRRRPGQSSLTTARNEEDKVEIVSGIYEGKTTGAPIGFIIRNKDQKSADYSHLEKAYRPSHADYTYDQKYGHRDHRGGGRSSARETACRVVAGSIAAQFLAQSGISVRAYVSRVGTIELKKDVSEIDFDQVWQNVVRCPDAEKAEKMQAHIEEVKREGDTVGGVITCLVTGQPPGLGEPVFDKLHAVLGHAMLSINAVKGFEVGSGFAGTLLKGSQHNDVFAKDKNNKVITKTNHSGGIQGGISNGMPITFNVAFKPVATLLQSQDSINKEGAHVKLEGKGRHDSCVVPRAVPIVEAMAALVMADFVLLGRAARL
jgi:chorismate synthase